MKQIFTLVMVTLICLLSPLALNAQDQENLALTVVFTSGTTVQFPLSEEPVVKMDGSNIVFTSTKADATYERASVATYFFKAVEIGNAVNEITDESKTSISVTRAYITISNPNKLPLPIRVYSITGALMTSTVDVISDNTAKISISRLTSGVYIVKTNNESFKFLKK